MTIRELITPDELKAGYEVMRQLRTHLSYDEFFFFYKRARAGTQYCLYGLYENDAVIAVMGCRVLYDMARGKQLYIDDLVTTESKRSQGHGAELLKHADQLAANRGCNIVRLAARFTNERGQAFYEREGWQRVAVIYQKQDDAPEQSLK